MKTEAEKQLAKLVRMPTLSDDIVANDMALDYIENYLKKRGMHCHRNRFDGHGTLVASTRPDNAKNPTVLLAAHVDVMTGSEQLFQLRADGDKLLGRGVFDMKSAIAAYMQVVDDLQDNLDQYNFAIMITTDEEYGTRNGVSGTLRLVEIGHKADVCILPDSTSPGWEVEKLAKGVWRFDLVAKGRTAHGSRPWEGESASFKLIHALHEIKTLFDGHGQSTNTLNIGFIRGGETYNQIPELMTAAIEVRLVSEKDHQILQAKFDSICKKYDISTVPRSYYSPNMIDITQPLLQSYMDSVERITDTRPKGYISCGQSDAKHLAKTGTPSILSCPMGGGHHSESEWISRKSFLQFVPILHDFLNTAAKTPAPASVDTTAALV